jgi:hypothetical protein
MSSLTTLFGDFVKRPYLSLTAPPSSKIHSFPDPVITDDNLGGVTPTSIASSGSMYVMAYSGGAGNIMSSPDGITWTTRAMPNCSSVMSVAYGNSVFVAYATHSGNSNSYIWTSTDGVTWTFTGVQPEPTLLYGKVMDGGNCVIYGSGNGSGGGAYYKSTNGTIWTYVGALSSGNTTGSAVSKSAVFSEVVGSYRFLGATNNYYSNPTYFHRNFYAHYSSNNGITWTAIRANTIAVFYYNSLYYVFDGVSGDVLTTTDFVTYTYFRKWLTKKVVVSIGSYGGSSVSSINTWGKLINKFICVGFVTQATNNLPIFCQVSDIFSDLIQEILPLNINIIAGGSSSSAPYPPVMTFWYSGISFGNKHWFYKSNSTMVCIDASINEVVIL